MPIEIGKLVVNLNIKGDTDGGKQSKKQDTDKGCDEAKVSDMIGHRADEVMDIISKKNER